LDRMGCKIRCLNTKAVFGKRGLLPKIRSFRKKATGEKTSPGGEGFERRRTDRKHDVETLDSGRGNWRGKSGWGGKGHEFHIK